MTNFRIIKLLVVIGFGASAAYAGPAAAQILKKEPDTRQLSCGQKVLVDNQTCSPSEILEVTGSCLSTKPAADTVPRGLQYNCIKRK